MQNMHPRTCRQCGSGFEGGPRAWYCPACREERRREQSRKNKRRQKRGLTRALGSVDVCVICGKQYLVRCGNQKYCPECASEAVAAIDRQQGLDYYRANAEDINPARMIARRKGLRPCAVCGEAYDAPTPQKTCGKESCRRELARRNQRRADKKRSPRKKDRDDDGKQAD